MPVLEGALEHSVDLAAAMDSRGYGRTFDATRTSRRITTGLMFGGLLGVCVGVYGLLDGTTSSWFGLPMLCAGSVLAATGIILGGRRAGRSRDRADPWAAPEWLVVACGAVPAVAMFVNVDVAPEQLFLASVVMTPPVPALACLGIFVGALPAVLAPPQPLSAPAARTVEPALEVAR
jgi:energy-coupling factor transport system permease protein